MRILLIGGAGFLGVNSAISLMASGHQVFIFDRARLHSRERSLLHGVSGFYEGDLTDFSKVFDLIVRESIEVVINYASTLIPSSDFDAFSAEMASGSVAMFRLINGLAERRIKYVFFSSGGVIYGRNSSDKIKESEPRQPINLYGLSKLMLEEYIEYAGRTHGLEYLIIRPSNPYGPHQNPYGKQGFIAVALARILKGEPVEVWGDGSVVRDYIHVRDMTDALCRLIESASWNQVFNIGSGTGYSIRQVLDVIRNISGKLPAVNYSASRVVDTERLVLDVTKLKGVIDFDPRGLEAGIRDYHTSILSDQ